ncbi:hypothetical protein MKX70_16790 [Paenibacillus sp. FSL R7-0312]|uniref:hypothetical protein n=1 Tax=Paenibacillus sp. FSL R7-0312 TaxID=2921682 RepID=UPI0030F4B6A4
MNQKRRKRKHYTDDHSQKTYYIENSVLAALNEINENVWGETSKTVNKALSAYITDEYPEIAKKHALLNQDIIEEAKVKVMFNVVISHI